MIAGIIPARFASTRFPGKPLVDIRGKTMIQRVYEQCLQSKHLQKIIVATDDERIAEHITGFKGDVVMTSAHHQSGTDRCFEALQQLSGHYDYVINIQGDEPFIQPEQIDELAAILDGNVQIATQMMTVENHEQLFNESEAKIILNKNNEAAYFSRMAIPYLKGISQQDWHKHYTYYRHVGMYAYRTDILQKITALPTSELEKAESLEQLRWIENGFAIKCIFTQHESFCIDTPEDLEKALAMC